MADLTDLPTILARDWGLTVVNITGWEDRKRPGAFAPIGVLIHHTAAPDRSKDAPSLQICIDGRRDLPGPLCQLLVARSGKVYVISRCRCNHAGTGGPIGPVGVDQGNTLLVGIEAENDGVGEPWPAVQVGAMVRATAAVLDLLGQPRANVWGHREYTPRKIDPAGIAMAQFRADVAAARPPGATTVPTPTTPTGANPYPAETAEALELLAQHAGYTDPDRKWFGPEALKALHRLKNRAEGLAATNRTLGDANRTSADTIARLTVERNLAEAEATDAIANREAAEAEAAKLRAELQTGGRLPAVLPDIDTACAALTHALAALEAALTKARA